MQACARVCIFLLSVMNECFDTSQGNNIPGTRTMGSGVFCSPFFLCLRVVKVCSIPKQVQDMLSFKLIHQTIANFRRILIFSPSFTLYFLSSKTTLNILFLSLTTRTFISVSFQRVACPRRGHQAFSRVLLLLLKYSF